MERGNKNENVERELKRSMEREIKKMKMVRENKKGRWREAIKKEYGERERE